MAIWRWAISIILLYNLDVVTSQDDCKIVNRGVLVLNSNQSSSGVSAGDTMRLSCKISLNFNYNTCNASQLTSEMQLIIGTGVYTSYVSCFYQLDELACYHYPSDVTPDAFMFTNGSNGSDRNYTASIFTISKNTVELTTEYRISLNSSRDPWSLSLSNIPYTCEFKSTKITKSLTKYITFQRTAQGLTLSVPNMVEYGDNFTAHCTQHYSYMSPQTLLPSEYLEISLERKRSGSDHTMWRRVINRCGQCTELSAYVNGWDDLQGSTIVCNSSLGYMVRSQPIQVKNTVVLGNRFPHVVINRYDVPTRLDCQEYLFRSGKLNAGDDMTINYTWIIYPYGINPATRSRSEGPVYIHGVLAGPPYEYNAECQARREGSNQRVMIRVVVVNAYCRPQQAASQLSSPAQVPFVADVKLGIQGDDLTDRQVSVFNDQRFIRRTWIATLIICLSVIFVTLVVIICAKYNRRQAKERLIVRTSAVAPIVEPKIDSVTVLNDGTVVMDVKNGNVSSLKDVGIRNSIIDQVVEAEDRARSSVIAAGLAEQVLPSRVASSTVVSAIQTTPLIPASYQTRPAINSRSIEAAVQNAPMIQADSYQTVRTQQVFTRINHIPYQTRPTLPGEVEKDFYDTSNV